jgi:hypothetical protein
MLLAKNFHFFRILNSNFFGSLAKLLAKSSFPSLKTPTVLSQQELGNPVGKAFANRVGVLANSLALLAKRAFPVVF